MGSKADQNSPAYNAGLSSLPSSSFRPFLSGDENIRVQSTVAIGSQDRASIKQTEWTYALMMHFSNSLGVNCTFCHNTRSMGEWSTSPVTREQAWYGIRMVRDLNNNYLEPLTKTFPENRLGVTGDGPKVNCATCHQGAYKPLLGVSMLGDYPVLSGPQPQPQKTVVQASPSMVEAADGGMVVLSQDGGGAAAAVGLATGASDGGLVTAVPDGAAPLPNALTTDAGAPSVPTSGAAAASARKPSAESPHP
jgi:photosynthetic reaction center cytochrome c subunit